MCIPKMFQLPTAHFRWRCSFLFLQIWSLLFEIIYGICFTMDKNKEFPALINQSINQSINPCILKRNYDGITRIFFIRN